MPDVVILISSDWVLRPRIEAATTTSGWEFRSLGHVEQLADATNLESLAKILVLLDLSAVDELTSEQVVEMTTKLSTLRFVAFGPHVQTEALERAESIGCHAVWTNGELQRFVGSGQFPGDLDLWA